MGSFDAGTIEAKLTLDRTPFKRGLDLARAEAKRFEANDIKVDVEVDGAEAMAEAAAVRQTVKSIPDRKTTRIEMRTGNGVTQTQALVTAILAGLPLVPALAAPATAAIVALGTSFLGAAGGVAVLGLGIVGAFKSYNEAVAQAKANGTQLTGQFRAFDVAFRGMKTAYDGFVKSTQDQSLALMGQFFNLLASILPRLVPIFNAFATVASGALNGLSSWFAGPEGTAVLRWFQTFGAQQFGVILGVLGDLARTILNVAQAFSPFTTIFMNGLRAMTTEWVKWSASLSSSSGFQQFIAYVQQVGPQVIRTLVALWDAVVAIAVALAPLGPVVLSIIEGFANLISTMNPGVLRAIVVTIIALVTAFTVYEATMKAIVAVQMLWAAAMAVAKGIAAAQVAIWAAMNFALTSNVAAVIASTTAHLASAAAMGVVRAAVMAWTAVQWLLNAALTANPIGIIIVAIAALVAALIYAWNNSETFRNVVIAVWNGIKAAVQAVVNWFTGSVVPWFKNAWANIVATWNQAKALISTIMAALVAVVRAQFNAWLTVVTTVTNAIRNALSAAWNAIRAVVTAIITAIVTVARVQFNAMMAVITAITSAIRNAISAGWNAIRNVVTVAATAVRAVVTAQFNAARAVVTAVINAIRSVVTSGSNGARAAATSAFNGLRNAVQSALNGARSAVSGAISSIRGMFSGAGGWLVGAGRQIIQGLISGISSMIGSLKSQLSSVTNMIPDWKGPRERDAALLRPAGRLIMGGLMRGINDQVRPLQRTLNDVTTMIGNQAYRGSAVLTPQGTMGSGSPVVNFYNYYPVAEPSSLRASRQMTELAVMGVFSSRG